jgi:hypothetical protein
MADRAQWSTDLLYEWNFRDRLSDSGAPNRSCFAAGLTWLGEKDAPWDHAAGIAAGLTHYNDGCWRLMRFLHPEQLAVLDDLESQTEMLVDWIEATLAEVRSFLPRLSIP